jgi:hypothetical protein
MQPVRRAAAVENDLAGGVGVQPRQLGNHAKVGAVQFGKQRAVAQPLLSFFQGR